MADTTPSVPQLIASCPYEPHQVPGATMPNPPNGLNQSVKSPAASRTPQESKLILWVLSELR